MLELRAVALPVRKYLCTPDHADSRLMAMTDLLVAIRVAAKGRNGSAPLLRRSRILAASILAAGVVLYMRWVPGW